MDTVDGFRGNIDCAVETERHIRTENIIIDGFGQMDNVQSFLPQKVGTLLGAVSAQNHQAVQTQLMVSMLHRLHLVQSVGIRHAHLLERLTGAA